MRAKTGIMTNVGSIHVITAPGAANAAKADRITSSDPQPVTICDGATP